MTTHIIPSWSTQSQLEELATIERNGEIVEGIVRSTFPTNKRVGGRRSEMIVVALPNGTTGYCADTDFAIREFNSYREFVGRRVKFKVQKIDLEARYLVLSGKAAQEELVDEFWQEIVQHEIDGTLSNHSYDGVVTGVHPETSAVFVNVNGLDTIINRNDWSYNPRDVQTITPGEIVQVIVKRSRITEGGVRQVQTSRRELLPNPFELLGSLPREAIVAGKVTRVHPIEGIHVELENGLDVKASRRKTLDAPEVGDTVSCRVIQDITLDEARGRINGRVLITGYPNGKRKRKELGSFLFAD